MNADLMRKARTVAETITASLRCSEVELAKGKLIAVACLMYKHAESDVKDQKHDWKKRAKVLAGNESAYPFVESISELTWEALFREAERTELEVLKTVVTDPSVWDGFLLKDFSIPQGVRELIIGLLDLHEDDFFQDLGCSNGDMLLMAGGMVGKEPVYGCDADPFNVFVTSLRMEIAEFKGEFEQQAPFDRVSVDQRSLIPMGSWNDQRTKICLNFPCGKLPTPKDLLDQLSLSLNLRHSPIAPTMEWSYAELVCNRMGYDGRAIVILPNGSLNSEIAQENRKLFVERGLVETIVMLPPKVFDSIAIPTSLVVLGRRDNNRNINFVDATNLGTKERRHTVLTAENVKDILNAVGKESEFSCTVTSFKVEESGCNLLPSWYLNDPTKTTNQQKIPLGAAWTKLGDVVERCQRGETFSAEDLDYHESTETSEYRYLKLSNIQDGFLEGNMVFLKDVDPMCERAQVQPEDILVSRNGKPFRIAIADKLPEGKIIANGNLYILRIDKSKANPYYIKALLDSSLGRQSLERNVTGATLPVISAKALMNVELPLPSLFKQDSFADDYRDAFERVKKLKNELTDAMNELNGLIDGGRGL